MSMDLNLPKVLLLVGLCLVILSRGCDSINSRSALRAQAKVSELMAEDDVDMDDVKDAREEAKNVGINNALNAYWFECMFVFGTMLLVIGLVTVGFTGEMAERILCSPIY